MTVFFTEYKNIILTGFAFFLIVMLSVMLSRNLRLYDTHAISFSNSAGIYVAENAGIEKITTMLDSLEVRYSPENLEWSSKIMGWRSFKKGYYSFSGDVGYDEFLSTLSLGKQSMIRFLIPPGIDIARFDAVASAVFAFEPGSMEAVMRDSAYLKEKGFSAEELFGKMLPDTYFMYWTSSPAEVLNRLLAEFENVIVKPYQNRLEELDYSINQITILASIIEWEAANNQEKKTISGLYWNRLKRRMPLQADPTILYALGERRRVLFEDYSIDHPFNTYKYIGLPPGPITNPAKTSIEAALFPEEHSYLYMVRSPEGGHIFTRTYAEHQEESEKWRRWLRQQVRIRQQQEREGVDRN